MSTQTTTYRMWQALGNDLVVPVSVTDHRGLEVVHADITTWVTPAR
jgi:hypothetical protein